MYINIQCKCRLFNYDYLTYIISFKINLLGWYSLHLRLWQLHNNNTDYYIYRYATWDKTVLISNGLPDIASDEVMYPSRCTVDVREWINNSIPHFAINVINYPCWDLSKVLIAPRSFISYPFTEGILTRNEYHLHIQGIHVNRSQAG